MDNAQALPTGYIRNAAGHLVPEDQVREHDKLRDQIARDLAAEAIRLNKLLTSFKRRALDDIADVVRISAARYDVKLGGRKGNVSIATYDGDLKVVRSYAERLSFTEELEAAKELINQCIREWSEGGNANMKVLVDRAFRANSQGQLKTSAILDLLRADIDDPSWLLAMEALKDSIQAVGTCVYIRFYRRVGRSDKYEPIPLDLAVL